MPSVIVGVAFKEGRSIFMDMSSGLRIHRLVCFGGDAIQTWAFGRTWGDVGLNNRERMLWGDIWCCCEWGTIVVIIVIKVISVSIEDIIQWVIVIWRWIIGCMDVMGVGGGRGCDRV
jgi:hypothetical protein